MLILAMMKKEPGVEVELPKFDASGVTEISPFLKPSGMTRAFAEDAQFGPACGQVAGLSRVIHRSVLNLAEAGAGPGSKAGSSGCRRDND